MSDSDGRLPVEKGYATHVDHAKGEDNSSVELMTEFTPAEQRHIIRRIDRRLVIIVGVMYCISLMDRTNLSAAMIAGMQIDLKLGVPYRYSIITLVFFITYVVFQPPSTVLIRRLGPKIHLSAICFFWGCCMIGMGFANDWRTLAGLRVILGVLEAGFFPGCVYLLSTWYVRYDMGKRYSLFYILGSVASACAGILAFGIMQMEGIAGYKSWRWIFIIDGILTCAIAVLGYVLLVGFPDDEHKTWPSFLNARERKFIIDRVNADRGDAVIEPFSFPKFLRGGSDIKIWGYALIFFNTTTISYALAYFLPIILREGMKFSVGASQCLVAPPYVFAGFVMWGTAWVGDKYRVRGAIIIFNMLLCVIGLPIMGWATTHAGQYIGVFFVAAGANANVPATMTYQANNIRGQWKRAFCSATLVGMGGVGGIAGSLVFRAQDKPQYRPGMWACLACALWNIILVSILSVKLRSENKKANRGEKVLEGSEEGFRYTI